MKLFEITVEVIDQPHDHPRTFLLPVWGNTTLDQVEEIIRQRFRSAFSAHVLQIKESTRQCQS